LRLTLSFYCKCSPGSTCRVCSQTISTLPCRRGPLKHLSKELINRNSIREQNPISECFMLMFNRKLSPGLCTRFPRILRATAMAKSSFWLPLGINWHIYPSRSRSRPVLLRHYTASFGRC
jgi:hypothetical protein